MTRPGARSAAWLAAVVLATLGLWLSPQSAFACDCAGVTTAGALRQADAVFHGTLLTRDEVGRGKDERVDLRFSVDAVYKGSVYAEQVVATRPDDDSCGLSPEPGSSWIVFALDGMEGSGDEAVSRLITTLCSGNLPGANAPAVLGRPHPPTPGRSDRAERSTNADRALTRWLVGAGITGLVMVGVAGAGLALIWRPGRTRP